MANIPFVRKTVDLEKGLPGSSFRAAKTTSRSQVLESSKIPRIALFGRTLKEQDLVQRKSQDVDSQVKF